MRPRLHERSFACDGDHDAILFSKLSPRRRAAVATLGDKFRDFVAENLTH